MSRVLIVEDEAHLAEGLRFNIQLEGHAVDVVGDGESALARVLKERVEYDAILLDVMLPGRDGFQVASEIRRAGEYVPILMLTARGRAEDVLSGFEAGADDYLPKPFELAILLARLRGLLRRHAWMQTAAADRAAADSASDASASASAAAGAASGAGAAPGAAPVAASGDAEADEPSLLDVAGKTLDLKALELRVGETSHHLTVMECDLLKYLVKNAGQAVSRKAILENVWGVREDTDTRAIDNFIVRLRRYIEDDPARPRHLLTVRGVGYKLLSGAASSRS